MAKNQKRTIDYVYGLDPEKASRLVTEVCNGTLRSSSCVYQWMRRKRRPCFLEMQFVQKQIREIYGLDIPLTELFSR